MLLQIGRANWNLEIRNGRLLAVAKPGTDAANCYFGDRHHIAKLLGEPTGGEYAYGWTEAGRAYLAGLQSSIASRRVCFAQNNG